MNETRLVVSNLTMRFGGIVAVNDLSFSAPTRQVTSVIGPNGAGKTTAFNCVTGFYKPSAGTIALVDAVGQTRVDTLPGHRIVSEGGIARTFQNIRLFAGMTVLENLLLAQHAGLSRKGWLQLQGLFGLASYRRAEAEAIDRAMGWLERMGLAERANDEAGTLAYGLQRRLEIARAMCLSPRFLCLDEPAAGLNPKESARLAEDLHRLKEEDGIGVLLIEHDMSVVMKVSDRIIVLEYGSKIADGTPDEVHSDPRVVAAYLGQSEEPVAEDEAPIVPKTRPSRPKRPKRPISGAPQPLLSLKGVSAGYGPAPVLHEVDVSVAEGEIVTLLGANGAGKSTLLRTICGKPAARAGTIHLGSQSLLGLASHEIARRGIAHAPEGRRIMPKMTVLENLQLGATANGGAHFSTDIERVFAMFPRLEERRHQRAGTMSGGEQQMLAIGRALMQRPRLLLLDEPSLGLAPMIIRQIFDAIRTINEEDGVSILLVEQNAVQALRIADRGYVLQTGRIVHAGAATELLETPEIRTAYLDGVLA